MRLPDIAPGLDDRIQVQQVVMNLIPNDIDAMVENASDSARLQLTIESRRAEGGSVRIAVADEGTGISPGIPDELFTPLATAKKTGMGTGLSVSKSIVEAHGGRIRAEPNVGRGARFVFTMPISPAQ